MSERNSERAAFEVWLYATLPSGDCESVQQQWLESDERANWLAEQFVAAMQPWHGGPRPVGRDEQVKYRTRDGLTGQAAAKSLTWTHNGGAGDIVAYEAVDGTASMIARDSIALAKSGAMGTPRAAPLRDPWPVAGFTHRLGGWQP
jgi:hypothetical protein